MWHIKYVNIKYIYKCAIHREEQGWRCRTYLLYFFFVNIESNSKKPGLAKPGYIACSPSSGSGMTVFVHIMDLRTSSQCSKNIWHLFWPLKMWAALWRWSYRAKKIICLISSQWFVNSNRVTRSNICFLISELCCIFSRFCLAKGKIEFSPSLNCSVSTREWGTENKETNLESKKRSH